MALYDRIGRTYDVTRRADPEIVERLARLMALTPGAAYLDVACGTGNYTIALANRGATMYGLDQSATMLAAARRKTSRVSWCQGDAERLPFRDRSFAGAVCTLAIHHFHDRIRAFEQVFRVMCAGPFAILTVDREQMERYWLNEYFPEMMAAGMRQLAPAGQVERELAGAGFGAIAVETWDVPDEIEDWGLYAGKHHPEIYLDPAVRAGISIFANLASAREVERACERLAADLRTGRFAEVARSYANSGGDYIFIAAHKR
jgi:SAM-dependent methyltransferase